MKIRDLRLALSATPKKPDDRYSLNGLNITKTHVTGSNGHVLCHINTYANDIPDQLDNNGIQITDSYLIVPVETIKALLKKMGSKHDNFEAGIFLNNGRYELSCMNQVEVFEPIGHKYPGFQKIIEPIKLNDHDKNLNAIRHQFDWSYVALANDALGIYFGNKVPKRLYSCNECGYMMPCDAVIYVIMPCRN